MPLPLARTARIALSLVAALAFLAASACSGGDSASDATATPGPDSEAALQTTTTANGWTRVEGLRGDRYCEVLLPRIVEGRLNAEVWNTYGLNDCPEDEWKQLDAAAIKEERGSAAALLNGPRYWLMDAIERRPGLERKTSTFGPLQMFQAATVDIGPIPPDLSAFKERRVDRAAIFEFSEGAQIYELHTPEGKTYVMQAYSVQNDPALNEDALATLGESQKLTLPAGWTYTTRVLDAPLRLQSKDDKGAVVQDNLNNSYTLVETP